MRNLFNKRMCFYSPEGATASPKSTVPEQVANLSKELGEMKALMQAFASMTNPPATTPQAQTQPDPQADMKAFGQGIAAALSPVIGTITEAIHGPKVDTSSLQNLSKELETIWAKDDGVAQLREMGVSSALYHASIAEQDFLAREKSRLLAVKGLGSGITALEAVGTIGGCVTVGNLLISAYKAFFGPGL